MQGTPNAFLQALGDYASRRGWQPIVAVQPQPDEHAIHLIPSAANPDLAAVLLQSGTAVQPACISRGYPSRSLGRIRFQGQSGQLVAPYPTSRHFRLPVQVRDGDCLRVNLGPFGPPPPTPMRSGGIRPTINVALLWLLFSRRSLGLSLLAWLLLPRQAMQDDATGREPIGKPVYGLHRFPWREPPHGRTAAAFCDRPTCRYTLLCPWTGPHGVHTASSSTPLSEIWHRYHQGTPGWPAQQYYPVWPGPRHDRLTIVPLPPTTAMACVVLRYGQEARSQLLPAVMTYDNICRAICYQSPWDPGEVRLPPALFQQYHFSMRRPITLRTGDVLEVLNSRADRYTAPQADQALIRDYVPWTQGIRFLGHVLLRLWSPEWNRPIVTWLHPGTEWLPSQLTFTGSFSGPSRVIQLIAASLRDCAVNVLVEHHTGSYATSFDHTISIQELADELHTLPQAINVVGCMHPAGDEPLRLRDGDIIHDSLLMGSAQPLYGWPDDGGDPSSLVLPVGLALLTARIPMPFIVYGIAHSLWTYGAATRSASGSRTPSRNRHGPAEAPDSPRIGRWRPDSSQPLSDVVSTSRLHYRFLCPFRGWSPPAQGTRSTTLAELVSVMHGWSSIWALHPVLQGGPQEPGEVLALPGGLAPLATTVVYEPGTIQARLLPRVCTISQLVSCLQSSLQAGTTGIRLPPALHKYTTQADATLHLRDGDSFEVYSAGNHPHFRPGIPVPAIPLSRLPHFSGWHLPFQLAQGGWVRVWDPWSARDPPFETRWVSQGAVWSPRDCRFHRPGGAPYLGPWIPTAWVDDGQCHFVRPADLGQACVLQLSSPDPADILCIVLPVSSQDSLLMPGWQLRPDLQARSPLVQLRDGDVLVPTDRSARRRVHQLHRQTLGLMSVASFSRQLRPFALLILIASFQIVPARGMTQPEDTAVPATVRVGRYPWRIPADLRLCDAAVDPGHQAVLFSPFTGRSEPVEVHPDLSIEDLYSQLAGPEPAWACGIIPVWPSPQLDNLLFVPTLDYTGLVVLLVVSPEWHAAYILPQRADPDWILNVLRRGATSVISGLRPPLSASRFGASTATAIDWRPGDVLLVTPLSEHGEGYEPPVFHSGKDVRHAALWAFDFLVDSPLPVTMWRPGIRPSRTTMPPPIRWHSSMQTFAGAFSRRYPGAWVPVPWIYNDEVHICLRAAGEHECNVILEEHRDGSLDGRCVTVNTWTTEAAIAQQVGVAAHDVVLLGPDCPTRGSLRDGDIFHFPLSALGGTSFGHQRATPTFALWPLLFSGLLARGQHCASGMLIALLWASGRATAAIPHPTPSASSAQVSHWVWSPFRGGVGPAAEGSARLLDQLHREEPWWAPDLALALPSFGEHDQHWVPRSPCDAFSVVLVLGPPAPEAVLMPRILSKGRLLGIFDRHFPNTISVRGRIPQLADHIPASTTLRLADGDVLAIRAGHWQPSLHGRSSPSFRSHALARVQGFWSHALEFHSNCWLLLWITDAERPIAIYGDTTMGPRCPDSSAGTGPSP